MPEENQPQPVTNPSLEKPKRNWKKIALVLVIILLIAGLIGVGLWLLLRNPPEAPSKQPTKQATTAAKPREKETKPERTKFAYAHPGHYGNIWVLDVVTKGKMQITADGSTHIDNIQPVFSDENSFTYLKCTSSKCELWLVGLNGNKFTTKQIKKFNLYVYRYSIDPKLNKLVYLGGENGNAKLHLVDLVKNKDKVVYETKMFGYGSNQDDSLYVNFSPDYSKILYVDTRGVEEGEMSGGARTYKIMVWDMGGNQLVRLTGEITDGEWTGNNSFVYRDIEKGTFSYDLVSKTSQQLSEEVDWSNLTISPNTEKLAHNKGFQVSDASSPSDSEVFLFDLLSKKDNLLVSSSYGPVWVNNTYLVVHKLRKCEESDNCLGGGGFTNAGFTVVNIKNNSTYHFEY